MGSAEHEADVPVKVVGRVAVVVVADEVIAGVVEAVVEAVVEVVVDFVVLDEVEVFGWTARYEE